MDTPIAHPTAIVDLVDYQPGSVVSRVLIRNSGAVMTLFAFAQGEGLTEHMSPHEATVHLLEGEARITIAGEPHTVRAGEMLHLPASVPHALQGEHAFKMLLTILKQPPQ
jgi:quercetin dioxygenase-like cupin family protein